MEKLARACRASSTPKGSEDSPDVEVVTSRFETFEAVRPDGVAVVVKRNIDSGEQTVTEKKK